MPNTFRIVDVRNGPADTSSHVVEYAGSPELAAQMSLGLDLVRSGAKRDLVARVYWQIPGSPTNMVRLYSKVADRVTLAKQASSVKA